MKNKRPVKRLTEVQIYWILLISLIICIPILVYVIKSSISNRDKWINGNNKEIQELTATVTNSIYHDGRSSYYEITLDISDGAHRVYKLETDLAGTIPFYSININDEIYYAFSREKLYWEVYKVRDVVYSLVFALLIFGPVFIFLFLRETYGYGIRRKRRL